VINKEGKPNGQTVTSSKVRAVNCCEEKRKPSGKGKTGPEGNRGGAFVQEKGGGTPKSREQHNLAGRMHGKRGTFKKKLPGFHKAYEQGRRVGGGNQSENRGKLGGLARIYFYIQAKTETKD